MKHLSLQQAMLGMRVVQTDTGTIIKSPAGSAEYNLKGRRIKVNGHPQYFPEHLRVKDKRKPKLERMIISDAGMTGFRADGSVAFRIGAPGSFTSHVEQQKRTAGLEAAIDKIRNSKAFRAIVGETFLQPGTIHAGKLCCHIPGNNYTIRVEIDEEGKSHAAGIAIGCDDVSKLERHGWMIEKAGPALYQGAISHTSDEIRQKTLSKVLAATLPQRSPGLVEDDAKHLAKAVKAAFKVLEENDASKS